MKKNQNGDYECSVCGKGFEHRKTCLNHQEHCGIKSLDKFDDDAGFRKVHAINTALRRNDYDKNDTITDESVQVTLKNRKIGKNLNNSMEV